jgi:hypothetical protein
MGDNTLQWLVNCIQRDTSIQVTPVSDNRFTITLNNETRTVRHFPEAQCIDFDGTPAGYFTLSAVLNGVRLFLNGQGEPLDIPEAAKYLISLLRRHQPGSSN